MKTNLKENGRAQVNEVLTIRDRLDSDAFQTAYKHIEVDWMLDDESSCLQRHVPIKSFSNSNLQWKRLGLFQSIVKIPYAAHDIIFQQNTWIGGQPSWSVICTWTSHVQNCTPIHRPYIIGLQIMCKFRPTIAPYFRMYKVSENRCIPSQAPPLHSTHHQLQHCSRVTMSVIPLRYHKLIGKWTEWEWKKLPFLCECILSMALILSRSPIVLTAR
jgi:hypothetical protein